MVTNPTSSEDEIPGPSTDAATHHSFKNDVEFLAYISMGAAGVRKVVADLRSQGHSPLVLERGSDDFKLWKTTRIKGWRVPDILCVNDAKRVEVRAKSQFKISGSHSVNRAERQWSYGLADEDYMAFPICRLVGDRPVDWVASDLIQYVRVGDLKLAFAAGQASITQPKAASQGAEVQVVWPTAVAGETGTVTEVSERRVAYRRDSDNRPTFCQLFRKKVLRLLPQVEVGQQVQENQVLASAVPVTRGVPLGQPVGVDHYLGELSSSNARVRFAAAKALSGFAGKVVDVALAERMGDQADHIFIRLEAAASLARHARPEAWQFLSQTLADQFAENRLESCIVLAEIDAEDARTLLIGKLAQQGEHVDVRAGAAWALGEHRQPVAMRALADAFASAPEAVRIEAARALTKLARVHRGEMVDLFESVADKARPAVAFALRTGAKATVEELRRKLNSDDMRQWMAFVIGTGHGVEEIEKLKALDGQVYFAATLLWKMLTSGIYDLEEYG
ncbi:MAG: HEAT repeat domain-containing protein [Phycisphaerae bacterium]|nr:HEAT repeat domain-containing protein [Phycisphaerae bacterium]